MVIGQQEPRSRPWSGASRARLDRARFLLGGLGGLGCPAAMALAAAGAGHLLLVDDDRIELHNLHRQLLYREADCGRHKLDAARDALVARGFPAERIELYRGRLVPRSALPLARRVDVIVEGSDDFATKFLAADAGFLAGVPVVIGAATRWTATAQAIAPRGRPCYRCLFEGPPEVAPDPAAAGVLGPAVGVAGALAADLALRVLGGDDPSGGIHVFDGRRDRLRFVAIPPRSDCPLCGRDPTIREVHAERYHPPRPMKSCRSGSCAGQDVVTPDRHDRHRRLAEVGDDGQARIAALDLLVPDGPGAEVEREYLLRAGVRRAQIAPLSTPPFPHAGHFGFAAPREVAAGAWRALTHLRAALGLDGG